MHRHSTELELQRLLVTVLSRPVTRAAFLQQVHAHATGRITEQQLRAQQRILQAKDVGVRIVAGRGGPKADILFHNPASGDLLALVEVKGWCTWSATSAVKVAAAIDRYGRRGGPLAQQVDAHIRRLANQPQVVGARGAVYDETVSQPDVYAAVSVPGFAGDHDRVEDVLHISLELPHDDWAFENTAAEEVAYMAEIGWARHRNALACGDLWLRVNLTEALRDLTDHLSPDEIVAFADLYAATHDTPYRYARAA